MSESLVRSYSFHGVRVRIACSTERVDTLIHDYLREFSCPDVDKPDSMFELFEEKRDYPVPTAARLFMRYRALKGYVYKDTYYFTDYLSHLIIRPRAREVLGYISEDTFQENGERFFSHLLIHFTLLEVLRYFHLYPLHAAALESPEGAGFVFPADGYSGKTSITLLLAYRGFRYLSDDTVFLRPHAEGVEVLPFRQHFHIPPDLIPEFPDIEPFISRSHSSGPGVKKHSFPADQIFPEQKMDSLLNPGWIFFPTLTGASTSDIQPLSSRQALSILLPQSLEVMFNPDLAGEHLKSLRLLLGHAHCFRLLSGKDIHKNSDRLLEILMSARELLEEKD
jgi:hypothetical protein